MLSLPNPLPLKAFRNERILLKGGAFDLFCPGCYKYGSPLERSSEKFADLSLVGAKRRGIFKQYWLEHIPEP
jgi:hypothetical protein